MKFDFADFTTISLETKKISYNRTKISDTSHEDVSKFHRCRLHKFAINIFQLLAMTCVPTIFIADIFVFPLQQWLSERATLLTS